MSDDKTFEMKMSCFGCLALIVLMGVTLGLAWGLMTGLAHWVAGLFS